MQLRFFPRQHSLNEVQAWAEAEFGEQRLPAAIEAASNGSAKQILDHVAAEVPEWSNDVHEHKDITIVVWKKK